MVICIINKAEAWLGSKASQCLPMEIHTLLLIMSIGRSSEISPVMHVLLLVSIGLSSETSPVMHGVHPSILCVVHGEGKITNLRSHKIRWKIVDRNLWVSFYIMTIVFRHYDLGMTSIDFESLIEVRKYFVDSFAAFSVCNMPHGEHF
jgi:hypothetical protein